jgi:hypothetical protein
MRRAHCLTIVAALCVLGTGGSAQSQLDLDTVLKNVGERLEQHYKRARNVVFSEKKTMQPVGRDFSPIGFARVTEYELHVDTDAGADGDGSSEIKVVRQLLRVNGRAAREKDNKDRSGCTDENPLSPEPLAFLLPANRSEYSFVSGGAGKGKDANTLIIEFRSAKPEGKGELMEDPRGHDDCFTFTLPVVIKGRVWVDVNSYNVVRLEQRLAGLADISVPIKLSRRHNLENRVVLERNDMTIRYKTVPFQDPDEAMLLPESIETLVLIRGGLESIRTHQTFSDYRRFVTGARIVK